MILYQKPRTSFATRVITIVFNPVILILAGIAITLAYFALHDETPRMYSLWIGAVFIAILAIVIFYRMLQARAHEIILLELGEDVLKIQELNYDRLEESSIATKEIDLEVNKHVSTSKGKDGSTNTSVSYSLSIYIKGQDKARLVLSQPRTILGDILEKIKAHGAIQLKNNELAFIDTYKGLGKPLIPLNLVNLWKRLVLIATILVMVAVFIDFTFNDKKLLERIGFRFEGNKENYTVHTIALPDGHTDSVFHLSDQGIEIRVVWGDFRPYHGRATVSDGNQNIVMSTEYPSGWEELIPDSLKTTWNVRYQFNANDKPGVWHLKMYFDEEETVNYSFRVLEALAEKPLYEKLDCYQEDGTVNLSHFYQLSADEITSLNENRGVWYWSTALIEFKKRVTLCQTPEFNYYEMDEWERWAKSLSGKSARNPSPKVHERIEAVMPAYAEEFLFVNPEFVYWFSENMIPDPKDQQVNGWMYQRLYNPMQEAARNLALTCLYYFSLPNEGLDAQVQYAEMTARKYVNQEEERVMERNDYVDVYRLVNEWHEQQAIQWVNETIKPEGRRGVTYTYNATDMAFWLRRGIDGSANELWLGLREVLKKYDTEWYEQHIDPFWAP